MTHHFMDVIKASVNHLHPGQVPAKAMEQILNAIVKSIQRSLPEKYGEKHFTIMFGELYVEKLLSLKGRHTLSSR